MNYKEKFDMVKPVEVDKEWIENAKEAGIEYVPFVIKDGDEMARGQQKTVKLDFSRINNEEDIEFDVDISEMEVLDTEKGEMICWIDLEKLVEVDEINIYYGRSDQ